uniref:NADH-ubiquinone oxidoreductase chain 5 n=1 Tax=Gibbium aequinoctiale TaxID=1050274 RepID=A0A8J9R2R1_9COLE|nr:NADH dehydrogenase subunit 5 [Gibbium aequinoctiale]ATN40784.1 NADH dehydrogenase subunit 5 [Gibbium aequinoctiale]
MVCFKYFLIFLLLSLFNFLVSLGFLFFDYCFMVEYILISLNGSSISLILLFDWMSLMFSSFVMLISSMVIYYSSEYMGGDFNINRFIVLVVLFVASMLMMIFSPNLISILMGWDGLGLVSYCLVIYYQNVKSYSAGMLTALSNRIGDVALLICIAWMMNYGSWNFLFYYDLMSKDFSMMLVMMLCGLAAFTKSAQIPFSSWLPAAMAAPTPVSSLVHSSTLVTAGVYLMIRFSPSFSSGMSSFMLLVSCLTMFMAGLGANFEIDLKKIIALSTLSQLGLMMSILFVGNMNLSFFHLLTHALFKALLFMCAGAMIHNLINCQDIRYMGSLVIKMPLVCSFFCISNFSLCGIPFLSGFYSKDLILEFFSMSSFNWFIYFMFYVSVGLTVSYTFRLMYNVLWGSFNFLSYNSVNYEGEIMVKGMFGLIFLVLIMGSILSWLLMFDMYMICLSSFMKKLTLLVIVLGAIMGYEISKISLGYEMVFKKIIIFTTFVSSMWFMPYISTFGMMKFPLSLGYKFTQFDQGWLEYYGSQNIYNKLGSASLKGSLFLGKFVSLILILSMWIIFMYFMI